MRTYAFFQVPLHDRKFSLVSDVLHDEPRERLFVFGVDLACFDEFVFELGDAVCVFFGVEVYDYGVDHDCLKEICLCVVLCGRVPGKSGIERV